MSSLAPETLGRELFVRHAKKDGRSVAIPVARTGGVTSAITGPIGGLVAGQSAWVSLGDAAAPLAPIRAPVAIQVAVESLMYLGCDVYAE